MKFKELALLFRSQRFPDEVIANLDEFLYEFREDSFSSLDIQNQLNLCRELSDDLIREMITHELIITNETCDCPICDYQNNISSERCENCGTFIDALSRSSRIYSVAIQPKAIDVSSIDKELYQKRTLKYIDHVLHTQNWLGFLRFDLSGFTVLQGDYPDIATAIAREFSDSLLPSQFAKYLAYGTYVKQEGDAFVYIFVSAKKAYNFITDVFSMYGSYSENHIVKQVKIKAILTLLKEPLKLYLDLNNSFDVLGFDVSKAYRLEKKEEISVANKQGILIVTKDIVQQTDFDSSVVRGYEVKTSKWREKDSFDVEIEYYVIPF